MTQNCTRFAMSSVETPQMVQGAISRLIALHDAAVRIPTNSSRKSQSDDSVAPEPNLGEQHFSQLPRPHRCGARAPFSTSRHRLKPLKPHHEPVPIGPILTAARQVYRPTIQSLESFIGPSFSSSSRSGTCSR
jgi:hypothetical protein